ncbi:MAG: DNA primase [Nitratireductor sp.]
MRFPPSFLDEIRDRLPISDVIGTRVAWDKRKTNAARGDYWACCPFHGEKSPSFHCENRKGRYHCFGCGVSGDHFRFLTDLEGLPFPEAVERLAAQAGLPMPVMDRREQEREEKRATLFDVMEMSASFFEEQLQSAAGAKARAYLRERGMSARTQQIFRIGYAPENRNALKEHLAGKGVSLAQMEATGMLIHGEDIAVSYDRFRDRVMFPIPDSRGRTIAFGGRALRPDVPAKYLNSPETELFHKSNVLYNFARARKAAHETGQVIAAEGYMDVIALHAAGFANSVAPMGTALTEAQLQLLWRMNDEPVLCFDGDQAGQKAAWRAIDLVLPALQPGRSVRFAMLPEGKDPDDLLRDEGSGAMRVTLDNALPLADMLWSRETASADFSTPERKAALEARMREVAGTIRDENVRRHYGQDFSRRLYEAFAPAALTRNVGARNANASAGHPGSRKDSRRFPDQGKSFAASPSLLNSPLLKKGSNRMPLRESVLVTTVLNHPAILSRHFEEFAALNLTSMTARQMQGAILDAIAELGDSGTSGETAGLVRTALEECGLAGIIEGAERQLRENRIWQALREAGFEDAADGWKQALALHQRNHALHMELKAAENALATEDSEDNFARLVDIRNELARTEAVEALIDGFGLSSGRPAKGY